jgi:hypothetical protein
LLFRLFAKAASRNRCLNIQSAHLPMACAIVVGLAVWTSNAFRLLAG